MSLSNCLEALHTEAEKLRDALRALRLIVEDRPERGEVALVDRFAYAACDLVDWMDEAAAAVDEGRRAASVYPADLEGVRRAISICQQRVHRAARTLTCELDAKDSAGALAEFGRERTGEWRGWAESVGCSLAGCREPLFDVSEALFHCWQELTERMGAGGITVRAAVGQHISI